MLCGISFGFPELFPIEGQIAHVLRTRAPCAIPYCYSTRTRLACVKHAASVRSEPGSNSRLNLVAWRKKYSGLSTGISLPSELLIARIYSDHWRSKSSNGFEQILAHRIGCQRAKPPCPAERHIHSPRSMPRAAKNVNSGLTISTGVHRGPLPASGVIGCAKTVTRDVNPTASGRTVIRDWRKETICCSQRSICSS